MLAPIFKGATGGLSDDAFVGIPDSFQDSRNVEIRKNPRGITLTKKLVSEGGSAIDQRIVLFIKTSTNIIIACGEGGGIYLRIGGVWSKNSNSAETTIVSAIEFKEYVYFCTNGKIFRVLLTDISNTMTLTQWQEFTAGSQYHPMLVNGTALFVADKYYVSRSDGTIYENDILQVNPISDIRFLQVQGVNYKLYAQDPNKMTVYYWDGGDNGVRENVPYNGVLIEQLINKDGNDYVISRGDLQVIDGYKMTQVKNLDNFVGYSQSKNSIIMKDSSMFYGVRGGVFEWGGLNKNYPDVLSFSNTTSNNYLTDDIDAIFCDGDDLYVAWYNDGLYGIDKLSSNTYNAQGHWTGRVYYGDSKIQKKASVEVSAAFDKILTDDFINIYYRNNQEGSFILLETITSNSPKTNDYSVKVPLSGEWNFIEFKVELNSFTGATTPEFYELYLKFDNVES